MTSDPFLRVHIQGAGKIGRAFATALRKARWPVRLQSARRGRPRQVDADVVLLTVRDSQLLEEANAWVPIVPSHAVVLHAAGALEPRVLSVLRSRCRGIGQLHPLISVVDTRGGIRFEGAYALIAGNRKACQCATQIARVVGMHPWRNHHLDRATYHAAAGLMAGGTAALFYAATHILVQAGIAPRKAQHMLVPLLRSVADNIEHVGVPRALSGVIRRGDVVTLRNHIEKLSSTAPRHLSLYLAASYTQLEMARQLGDTSENNLLDVERLIAASRGSEALLLRES